MAKFKLVHNNTQTEHIIENKPIIITPVPG